MIGSSQKAKFGESSCLMNILVYDEIDDGYPNVCVQVRVRA